MIGSRMVWNYCGVSECEMSGNYCKDTYSSDCGLFGNYSKDKEIW
jgi:hypothetical protein